MGNYGTLRNVSAKTEDAHKASQISLSLSGFALFCHSAVGPLETRSPGGGARNTFPHRSMTQQTFRVKTDKQVSHG